MDENHKRPRAVILGCSDNELTAAERELFTATDPLGFILFSRNCLYPGQIRRLVASLRDTVGRSDAPILIDQEGGRVARLKTPYWRVAPPALRFAEIAREDAKRGREAAYLNARLIADELYELGITVNCAPVLDVPQKAADPIIGDRALGSDPEMVAVLGQAVCEGMLDGGILPVIKHIPGHGRATVDSHVALPMVEASRAELARTDLVPFRALRHMPWAMTAHVIYKALDARAPATLSDTVIAQTIRHDIGFDGLLISDDLSMSALSGSFAQRTTDSLAAGCDVVLHCNGSMAEMEAVAGAAEVMSDDAWRRYRAGEALRHRPKRFNRAATASRLDELTAG